MSIFKKIILTSGLMVAIAISYIGYSVKTTRDEIDQFETILVNTAIKRQKTNITKADLQSLPQPVKDISTMCLWGKIPNDIKWVKFEQIGQFRRPLTHIFQPTTAKQVIATQTPDLVFSADTPILGPIWAIAYDSFINGKMQMEARLLSTFSVMHEKSNPMLDQISLRRWLLESPSNPSALLPKSIVSWQAIDDNHARATVNAYNYSASMVASFDKSGALTSFAAEQDGDLNTPYHGSGEHVQRGDYQVVEDMRIPTTFKISRKANGKLYPFWHGKLTNITLGR